MTELLTNPYVYVPAGIALFFLLLQFKTSRPDGVVEKVHPYRRMVPIIMRTRNESAVYFDGTIRADKLEAYLDQAKEQFGANVTHVAVAAINLTLGANPRMNRFIAGRRIYKRNGRWITFSMKRQKGNAEAKLGVVKLQMTDGETFPELVGRINGQIKHERSGEKTSMDKELALFGLVPTSALRVAFRVFLSLDYFGLLPWWFMKGDGMFTSIFLANLGSVGMPPGYHHLYEWGNAPIFVMLGATEERAIVEDGQVVAARVMPVRFSYDERIDDGVTARDGITTFISVLEDPEKWLGGLEGGTSPGPMWPRDGEAP